MFLACSALTYRPTLPELPSPVSSAPPRLPSLVPIPVLELPSLSLTISISCMPAPPITAIRHISVTTKATSSTVSTQVRRLNQSKALAHLAGRSRLKVYIKPYQQQQRNFMNMSDDEDEEDQDTDFDGLNLAHYLFPNPMLEPKGVVLPTSEPPKSAPLPFGSNDSFFVTSSPSVRRRFQAHRPKIGSL